MTHDTKLAWLTSAAIACIVAGLITLGTAFEARPKAAADMQAVEALLVSHGLPVAGFAGTAPLDVDLIDAMAPAECAIVMRRAWAARIAVERMAPNHAADARGIARAVAAITARETSAQGCLP